MKKIIKNRVYDTTTAREVGFRSNGETGFDRVEETLYIKKTGEYFLYGHGGARTKYAVYDSCGGSSGSYKIIPMTYDEAREWVQDYLEADDYIAIFGNPEDENNTVIISIPLPKDMVERILHEAQQNGSTISEYIANHLS